MRNGLGKSLVFFPSGEFNWCYMLTHANTNLFHLSCVFIYMHSSYIWPMFQCFDVFFFWKMSLIFVSYYLLCRRKNKHFDVHFRRIRPVHFRRKMGNTRSTKEEMDGRVLISRQSWHFPFVHNMKKELFPICTLTWCVNNYVSKFARNDTLYNVLTLGWLLFLTECFRIWIV